MSEQQIKNLKKGKKLIFTHDGGVLSASIGNVFTFSCWYYKLKDDINRRYFYWQCQELIDKGNYEHNFPIYCTELFDPIIHTTHLIMNSENLDAQRREFISKYGEE